MQMLLNILLVVAVVVAWLFFALHLIDFDPWIIVPVTLIASFYFFKKIKNKSSSSL
jgi:hypothetical protein